MNIRRSYPRLKLTRVLSGRPATSGYPWLGLPKHSDEGKRIRSLVRAPKGFVIGSWDYSQIELRVAAHLSGDDGLIEAYRNGEDIHKKTAQRVFKVPPEQQDKSRHRLPAKMGNFGFWMGLESKGLTENIHKAGNLDWSADCPGCKSYKAAHADDCDSEMFFREYERAYPKARQFQQDRRQHCMDTGFAYGMWGERWYLPGIWSRDEMTREGTARQAFAIPIQSGNARLIKQAMARVQSHDLPWARKQGAIVEPLLWVHDELLFLIEEGFLKQWHRRVKPTMETVATLAVPIVAEGSYGPSWLEQTELGGL